METETAELDSALDVAGIWAVACVTSPNGGLLTPLLNRNTGRTLSQFRYTSRFRGPRKSETKLFRIFVTAYVFIIIKAVNRGFRTTLILSIGTWGNFSVREYGSGRRKTGRKWGKSHSLFRRNMPRNGISVSAEVANPLARSSAFPPL